METQAPKVVIIAVSYNDRTRLPRFIDSLRSLDYPNQRFVLVDNKSRDDSVAYVKDNYPQASIVQAGANTGTAGGYNRGASAANALEAKYYFTWSIDCILPPDCLSQLVEIAEGDPRVAVVQPVMLQSHAPALVDTFGGSFDLRTGQGALNRRGEPVANLPEFDEPDWVGTGMALIRQSAFQEVKGFDEGFFMYGDDVDLCFRLRARGYRLLVTTRTNAWHRHHELLQEAAKITTPLELCYVNRSRIYFVKKHGRPGDWRKVTARLIWAGVRPTARYLYRRVPELALAYWMGIWYGATSRMGKRMFAR